MQSTSNELVPLSPNEKKLLLKLYDERRRSFLAVYVILLALALGYAVRIGARSLDRDEPIHVSKLGMATINFSFLGTILISTGLYFLSTTVLPLKKDADSGVKEKVPFKINKKEYYAVSDQYFFAVDDWVNLHYEVSPDTFNEFNEGDIFYIYRGAKSKFVFEETGKYLL